ncbi:unnamed protein product [Didymodactylos carnosus]|uniref:Uncharacterized protein n=1 Tax=Didymodactylos carnosus TaxID=1234261 RepID=A0A815NK27_9BILA|nr:unnamed protein product [Didymodactylos carnosus]CAF4315748.1 unnamed protein product [Didymodactylos carnosus]
MQEIISFADCNKVTQEQIQAVHNKIKIINKDLTCQLTTDCTAIPTGARGCGGPSGYVVVSKLNHLYSTVEEYAKKTEELEQQYNRENNVISTCIFIMPPQVACISNECATEPNNLR